MLGHTAIWVDGVPAESLPLPDRGLDFGDGLFETMLLRGGNPLYLDLHLQRLGRGLRALAFPDCMDRVREALQLAFSTVAERGWTWAAMRLTVTRGSGPRGYAPPLEAAPRTILSATPLAGSPLEMLPPARLSMAAVRWPVQPILAGLKHLNRLEQVLAAAEVRRAGTEEAIMLGQGGELVSVTAGNLFLLVKGELLTPRLDSCGIAGTRRSLVMQRWAPACKLAVRETVLGSAQLEACQEMFFSNSLVGLRPIDRLGKRRFASHEACRALFEQYRSELR